MSTQKGTSDDAVKTDAEQTNEKFGVHPAMDDASMHQATGKTPDEWFAILDELGAVEHSHQEIARWLFEQYGHPTAAQGTAGLTGRWPQQITVRYEQARGLRAPGQRADGTFGARAVRSIHHPPLDAFDAAVDLISQDLGESPAQLNRDATSLRARWQLANGEQVGVSVAEPHNGKTPVTLTHEKIPDWHRLADARSALAQVLAKLEANGPGKTT